MTGKFENEMRIALTLIYFGALLFLAATICGR